MAACVAALDGDFIEPAADALDHLRQASDRRMHPAVRIRMAVEVVAAARNWHGFAATLALSVAEFVQLIRLRLGFR